MSGQVAKGLFNAIMTLLVLVIVLADGLHNSIASVRPLTAHSLVQQTDQFSNALSELKTSLIVKELRQEKVVDEFQFNRPLNLEQIKKRNQLA